MVHAPGFARRKLNVDCVLVHDECVAGVVFVLLNLHRHATGPVFPGSHAVHAPRVLACRVVGGRVGGWLFERVRVGECGGLGVGVGGRIILWNWRGRGRGRGRGGARAHGRERGRGSNLDTNMLDCVASVAKLDQSRTEGVHVRLGVPLNLLLENREDLLREHSVKG